MPEAEGKAKENAEEKAKSIWRGLCL